MGRNEFDLMTQPRFGMPEIVRALHPKPHLRAIAAELPQAQRHLRRYGHRSGKQAVQRLTRRRRAASLTESPSAGSTLLIEQFARMDWTTARAFRDTKLAHQ